MLASLLRELDRRAEDPDIDPAEPEEAENTGQQRDRLESLDYP